MRKIIALIIVVSLLLCSCENGNFAYINPEEKSEISAEENKFIKAVWLSYIEISELCKNLTERQFRERLVDLTANLLSLKINVLIVHAVANCDSFYESEILPKSRYINTDGEYDVFSVICEMCASVGIEIQAWINPYRVSSERDLSVLEKNKAVKKLYSENKDNILICESGIYLNPAESEVQKHILDRAREIIAAYPVDAIHIDDYFYPDMAENADESSYKKYKEDNGVLSVDSWRRENVNALISSLHLLLNANGKKLVISPAADIEKNYENKYADIRLWLENEWADEIVPQIYFGFENETAPFERTLESWIKETENKKIRLIIGLAFYKCGNEDLFAGSGKNEWLENCDIIKRQISLIKSKNTICGVAFFSYSHIFGKNIKKNAKKELQNAKTVI